jgi:hypothetical protein
MLHRATVCRSIGRVIVLWRVPAGTDPAPASGNQHRTIAVQRGNRRTTNRRVSEP